MLIDQAAYKHYSRSRCSSVRFLGGAGCRDSLGALRGLQDFQPRFRVRAIRIKNYEAETIYTASTMRNREESKHPSITAGLQQLRALGYRRSGDGGWGSDWGMREHSRCWLWLMSDLVFHFKCWMEHLQYYTSGVEYTLCSGWVLMSTMFFWFSSVLILKRVSYSTCYQSFQSFFYA